VTFSRAFLWFLLRVSSAAKRLCNVLAEDEGSFPFQVKPQPWCLVPRNFVRKRSFRRTGRRSRLCCAATICSLGVCIASRFPHDAFDLPFVQTVRHLPAKGSHY
jgi:hypothetical protein